MKLPVIPLDKANHALYGAVIASVGSLLAGPILGLVACLFAAIGKELYDMTTGRGEHSPVDALATLGGGLLVVVPVGVWV